MLTSQVGRVIARFSRDIDVIDQSLYAIERRTQKTEDWMEC
jgi:hypothetical protein